jgi:hypothetical protein
MLLLAGWIIFVQILGVLMKGKYAEFYFVDCSSRYTREMKPT